MTNYSDLNIITIDLEEWFIYEKLSKGDMNYYEPVLLNLLDDLLELLGEKGVSVTFFCLGVLAKSHPHIINKIANQGHEIGSHSNIHNLITELTPEQFYTDTKEANDCIEQITGKKVTMYRAPAFSITNNNTWAFDVLLENGIKYDSSVFPASRRFGGMEGFENGEPVKLSCSKGTLFEFPINYAEVLGKRIMYSGGGYFRLFPYWMAKKYWTSNNYNMGYFHLRDFDAKQKRLITPNYFFSYYGISGAFDKFKKLLNDFEFISLGQAAQSIDWNKVKTVKI